MSDDISVGDIVRAAAHMGRAFPILYFPNPDAAPVRFVVVDCERHFDAVDCACGVRPKVIYSTDRNGRILDRSGKVLGHTTEWVSLSCGTRDCEKQGQAITISCGAKHFGKAAAAMASVARSWWNAMRDRDGHADDMGANGGILVKWEDFYRYMNPESDEPPHTEATDPAEPGIDKE